MYASEARLLRKAEGQALAAVYPGKEAALGLEASRPSPQCQP